jgi:hypothetical protein
MKRLLVYFPILAVIALAVGQQVQAQEWRDHVDEKAKVKFSLPKDWVYKVVDDKDSRDFSSVSPDGKMIFFLSSEDPGFRTDDPVLLGRFFKLGVDQFLEKRQITVKNNSLVLKPGSNNNIKGTTFQLTALVEGAEVRVAGLLGFYKDRAYTCLIAYKPDLEGYLIESFAKDVLQRLAAYDPPPKPIDATTSPSDVTRHETWSIVMSKGLDYKQTYSSVDSVSHNDWINQKWKEGFSITSLAAGDRRWLVVMSKDVGYTSQTFSNEVTEFPGDFIEGKWGEGYRITSVANTGGKWVVLMTKGTGYTEQTYFWGYPFPTDKIKEKQALGFEITYLASDHKQWMVVMSKGSGYSDQIYYWTEDSPSDWINQKWSQGYYITSMASLKKMKAVVMSKGTSYSKQFFWVTDKLPEQWIQEIWKTDYRLTSVF